MVTQAAGDSRASGREEPWCPQVPDETLGVLVAAQSGGEGMGLKSIAAGCPSWGAPDVGGQEEVKDEH